MHATRILRISDQFTQDADPQMTHSHETHANRSMSRSPAWTGHCRPVACRPGTASGIGRARNSKHAMCSGASCAALPMPREARRYRSSVRLLLVHLRGDPRHPRPRETYPRPVGHRTGVLRYMFRIRKEQTAGRAEPGRETDRRRRRRPRGPHGGLELARRGVRPLVLEAGRQVGGIARTVEYKGFRFDIGGHRFFTKIGAGRRRSGARCSAPRFLRRPRLLADLLRRQVLRLPAQADERAAWASASSKLAASCLSYLWIRVQPIRPRRQLRGLGRQPVRPAALPDLLQDLHREGLGHALQRDRRGLGGAAHQGPVAVHGDHQACSSRGSGSHGAKQIKTLIDEFQYPRLGPGRCGRRFAPTSSARAAASSSRRRCTRIEHDGSRIVARRVRRDETAHSASTSNARRSRRCRCASWSTSSTRRAPEPVRAARHGCNYRDFLTVALIVDTPTLFPDNWIYIHDPSVKVGRIQNFKNWSPDMVPDPTQDLPRPRVLLLRGRRPVDDVRPATSIALGARELEAIGLLGGATSRRRQRRADAEGLSGLRRRLHRTRWRSCATISTRFSNLQLVGRNGMHKYNNQDHSMMTAMLAVAEPARRAPRRLGGQHRRRVPRGVGRRCRGCRSRRCRRSLPGTGIHATKDPDSDQGQQLEAVPSLQHDAHDAHEVHDGF